MKTFDNLYVNEIIIKKSRFIGIALPLYESYNIKDIIKDIKKKYPHATHYCYAYRYENSSGSNDDGEPAGTAGAPILKVLMDNNINRALICVIRYFGGIKLGASGLIRAYLNSSKEVINVANYLSLIKLDKYLIKFSYENENIILNTFDESEITNKRYGVNIEYEIKLKNDLKLNEIKHLLLSIKKLN